MRVRFVVDRLRAWLAYQLRRLADWLARPVLTPMEVPSFAHSEREVIESLPVGSRRHEVRRRVRGRLLTLYDGPKGSVARDKHLHEKLTRQPGEGWLLTDGVVRDYFKHPE